MYNVILADPPWKYAHSRSRSRSIESKYPPMKLADIKALPVEDWASENAVLYLWATAPKLPQALEVMAAWGFEYVTGGIWDKRRTPKDGGAGYWWRGVHEHILIGRRGEFSPPAESLRVPSILSIPRSSRHSEKPRALHSLIDVWFPDSTKLELFARDEYNVAWDVWGYDVECAASFARGFDFHVTSLRTSNVVGKDA